jgi:hypothetical protein
MGFDWIAFSLGVGGRKRVVRKSNKGTNDGMNPAGRSAVKRSAGPVKSAAAKKVVSSSTSSLEQKKERTEVIERERESFKDD